MKTMKLIRSIAGIVGLFVAVVLFLLVPSALTASAAVAAAPATQPVRKLTRFVPHAEDAPERVGAGVSRSAEKTMAGGLDFEVLAPSRSYLTTRASPTLFWYTTVPTSRKMLITLVDPANAEAKVYSTEFADPLAAGVQRLDLAKVNVKLKPGVYKWIFEFYGDQGVDLSRKSIGYITVLPPEDARARAIAASGDFETRLNLCAEQGIWYDLMAELADEIDRFPADTRLREFRDSAVREMGLLKALDARMESRMADKPK